MPIRTNLYLRTASEVRDEIEDYLNDSGNELATAPQYYTAMNRAINMWGRKVLIPHVYEFDFAAGVYDYNLPAYIRRPFFVKIRHMTHGFPVAAGDDDLYNHFWDDFSAFQVLPQEDGNGFKLHLNIYPNSEAGQIIWFAEPSGFPTGSPTITGGLTSTATSAGVTLSSYGEMRDVGYFKVNAEWIPYAGITSRTASGFTATNLIRGFYDTTAGTHSGGDAISWGIAVDDPRLWMQLADRVGSFIHLFNMHKSTGEDTNRHEKLYVALRDQADNFWRREGYVSQASLRFILNRGALGPIGWL